MIEKLRRNKSLIKEEIEAYWKTKKTLKEDQLNVISNALSESQDINGGRAKNMMQRSISMPMGEQKERAILGMHTNDELDVQRSNCWWTRSNWAFLNEPPVEAMEGPSYKYAAQYHVAADIGRAKTTSDNIQEGTTEEEEEE
ncbi:hypothetical protein KSP39_PZI008872 [Platanthera zijinensis]|uniref:Uncharacterized protein n=1 Tax=Platanthera zijinensis TaxID=2320716 RepID=A0AAP0FU64_9ASPA